MRFWRSTRFTAAAPAFVFAALAVLLVRAMPSPHSPLHYVIAGTIATTGALIAVFLRVAWHPRLRP